jgi:predicted Zn-ribbon and HTH transcriptional regulator
MPSTKTWLTLMLWAIGFGAAAGVLVVLFGAQTLIYRAMGTSFLVAGAALLMMAVSRLVDRESTRASGLLGMWLVLIEFALALALIWRIGALIERSLGLSYVSDAMLETMGWLLLAGAPSMAFLRLTRSRDSVLAGYLGLVLAATAFLFWMIESISDIVDPTMLYGRAMETGFWIGSMGLLVVGSLLGSPRLTVRPWRWIGIIAAVTVAALGIYGLWMGISSPLGEKVTAVIASVAALTCFANVLLLVAIRPQHRWLVYATIAAAALTVAAFDVMVIYEPDYDQALREVTERGGVAGLILTGSGILAIIVLTRLQRPLAIERSSEVLREVTVICPMCRRRQTLPTGQSTACGSCGLRMEIKIAEPRCPRCDYLLYHLTSPSCPECGCPIAGAQAAAESPASTP